MLMVKARRQRDENTGNPSPCQRRAFGGTPWSLGRRYNATGDGDDQTSSIGLDEHRLSLW